MKISRYPAQAMKLFRRRKVTFIYLFLAVAAGLGIMGVFSPKPVDTMSSEVSIPWLHQTVKTHERDILSAAHEYQVDPELVAIFITLESGGNPRAVSPAGAMGLMQIMPGTRDDIRRWNGIKTEADMFDAKQNIYFGTYYIRRILDQHAPGKGITRETVQVIAAGYNGGPGRAQKLAESDLDYVKADLPEETVLYSKLAADMWSEKDLPRSPTFDKWRQPVSKGGHNGHVLIKSAEKELGL